jgi:hypothetical protein
LIASDHHDEKPRSGTPRVQSQGTVSGREKAGRPCIMVSSLVSVFLFNTAWRRDDLNEKKMERTSCHRPYIVEAVTALWVSVDEWMDQPSLLPFDKVFASLTAVVSGHQSSIITHYPWNVNGACSEGGKEGFAGFLRFLRLEGHRSRSYGQETVAAGS